MHGTTCKSVYCHYDGYLEYTGKLLLDHYNSATANQLVARGDNSGVQKSLEDMNFYRDRGEDNVSWQVAHTFEEFLEQVDNCGGEYYYIMRDGEWYAGCIYDTNSLVMNGLTPLADALAANTIEQLTAETTETQMAQVLFK
jgi:hypothetical protein